EIWISRIPENLLDMKTIEKLCPNGKAENMHYLSPETDISGSLLAARCLNPYSSCDGKYPPLDEADLISPTEAPRMRLFQFASRNASDASALETAPTATRDVELHEPPLLSAPK
ncbi:MAG TPA: hypothetical protein VHF05_01540, partial [Candidatus Paceibacterota bacterium]|nr:hypothetical protein [Candidatus Paceibacterota bacterium]